MYSLWGILVYTTKDKTRKMWGHNEEKYTIIDSTKRHMENIIHAFVNEDV